MTTQLSGLFQLSKDVLIVPVMELPEESRAQFEYEAGDFAVSRLQSRNGSKIIGAEAADVLGRFREPRSVVEAVILFGREKNTDPGQVLDDAYPFLQSMVDAGFLVNSAGETGASAESSETGAWIAGSIVLDARVLRTLQRFEDTEVLLLSRGAGRHSVLKVERPGPSGESHSPIQSRLEHEASALRRLDGNRVPKVLAQGILDGRSYLEIEFVPGMDSTTAAAEWRQRDDATARRQLLALAQSIARAYVDLHEHGVVHGDVHPRNLLVLADGGIRVIDFGMAVVLPEHADKPVDRGGMPFFFEPELAQAFLAGAQAPRASEAGEQFAVAALIYNLMTGAHWQDFRLGRKEMLEDIVSRSPLSFAEREMKSWPELEVMLHRALSKSPTDRYASMKEFAAALESLDPTTLDHRRKDAARDLARLVDEVLANTSLEGPWSQSKLPAAPTTSITYGSAGIALGLLHIAQRRRDADILALADGWSMRANEEIGNEDAWYNANIEITPELVGRVSPYHTASGVHSVATLVAIARGSFAGGQRGLAGYLDATRIPAAGLDLTLGQSSVLLGSAILLDALQTLPVPDAVALRELGDVTLQRLWKAIDAMPSIALANVEYLGIAHGWAGFLYATLQWCRVSGSAIPPNVERRLDELAALGLPTGRGLEWPWLLNRPGEPMTMAGWCNGTCGYVFLWTLAHRMFERARYFELAQAAAWASWETGEPVETLCCGVAGQGYALLNMYRASGDVVWIDRARDLVGRVARAPRTDDSYGHSLYKGRFGLAVLAAELEYPDEARTPFFEPAGFTG